jgi:hypothetical protein
MGTHNPNQMDDSLIVKAFGDKAQAINEGDRFIATVTYVEGRKVAILKRESQHPSHGPTADCEICNTRELVCGEIGCGFKTQSIQEMDDHSQYEHGVICV